MDVARTCSDKHTAETELEELRAQDEIEDLDEGEEDAA
jgi:hypothetical protein